MSCGNLSNYKYFPTTPHFYHDSNIPHLQVNYIDHVQALTVNGNTSGLYAWLRSRKEKLSYTGKVGPWTKLREE